MPQKDEMKTILKSQIFEGGTQTKQYSKNFTTQSIKEENTSIDQNGVTGQVHEVQVDGIILVNRNVTVKSPYEVEVSHDFPLFKLHFEIEGYNHYEPQDEYSMPVEIQSGQFNLFYFPRVNGVLHFTPPHRQTLEIQFTKAFIKKAIGQNFKEVLKEFGTAIESKRPFLFWNRSQKITPVLKRHIQDILDCQYADSLKKPFLEAKVLELLVMIFASWNQRSSRSTTTQLSPSTHEKLERVVQHISTHLNDPLSIASLAALVGMNASKLKESFKVTHGTTLFKYITEQRMKSAKSLIEERVCNITEASYRVGYKNPQHFTVAFKKIYGLLPSELIK
ncbi:helix-turn-helix transcriptional regulator [Reichenbachiella agariperforans]|uniref:helix-turn-helix transcriptional regulator n=1 Tax=Reichenbachiella agariperforans TaxID=156994 RepID=UPI001C082BBB|nr:AraC family transcriptional regulator [Reichenbachiella agariperforans]MBU2914622.1 AraC family transcriptional regulator [Reichenbachiella agariperforans]